MGLIAAFCRRHAQRFRTAMSIGYGNGDIPKRGGPNMHRLLRQDPAALLARDEGALQPFNNGTGFIQIASRHFRKAFGQSQTSFAIINHGVSPMKYSIVF